MKGLIYWCPCWVHKGPEWQRSEYCCCLASSHTSQWEERAESQIKQICLKTGRFFPPSTNTAISVLVSVSHHTSAVPEQCGLGEDVTSAPSHQGQRVPRSLTPQQELSSRVSVVCRGSTGAWGRGCGLRRSLTFTVKAKINLKIMNLSNLPGHTYLLLSR